MNDRRDDWRSSVDEHLMSLTTAQKVTDKQLDDLELKYEAIDTVIRGDPGDELAGLAERLHFVETGLQEMRTTFLKIKMADVEVTKSKWEFAGKIIVQVLILLGMVLLGWDKLEGLYQKLLNQKVGPVEQRIERAKHPRGKPIVRIRIVQPSPEKALSEGIKDSNQAAPSENTKDSSPK